MAFKILYILSVVFLYSCSSTCNIGTFTNEINEESKYVVLVKTQVHVPYCGGAMPTPEQAQGYNTPAVYKEYLLSSDSTLESNYSSVFLNEDGYFHMSLNEGKYFLYQKDKALNIEQFMTKYGGKNSYEVEQDKACFETWKKSPDFSFTVNTDSTYIFTYKSFCFTGTNPCISYDGPYPP